MLLVVFFAPALGRLFVRIIKRTPKRRRRHRLSLFQRCLSVLLAYVILISPVGFETLAKADIQYGNLQASDWGAVDESVSYSYDANGSMLTKTIVNGGTTTTYTYEYNLQNRINKLTKSETGQTDVITHYKYNLQGIRVQKEIVSGTTTDYLIDPYNYTGYSQVLVEDDGTDKTTYVIGDDVLEQVTSVDDPQYLLYDGHGSTRQVTDKDSNIDDNTEELPTYTHTGYDALGRKVWQSAQTRQTDRNHTDNWDPDTIDDRLRKREFEYDAVGKLKSVQLPDPEEEAGTPEYKYNPSGIRIQSQSWCGRNVGFF